MLNVFFKFLIMPKIYPKLIKSTNVILGLKYWYNSSRSPKSLIESLENYSKLSMQFISDFSRYILTSFLCAQYIYTIDISIIVYIIKAMSLKT